MSNNSRFPMEITIKIAKILYNKDCFVELESLMYIFPELSEIFSYKFPTIALVHDDQFEKVSEFLYTRDRPFGSKDLFIIRQTLKPDEVTRRESRCYMVLGSGRTRSSILRAFKAHYRRDNVTLVEQHNILTDSSFECYELIWTVPDLNNSDLILYLPTLHGVHIPFGYALHVGVLLQTFLVFIEPRFLRFESYSSKTDVDFEWEQLYGIYSSYISSKYPGDVDSFDSCRFQNDNKLNMPKCSFELVKTMHQLSSLHQHSSNFSPDTLEWSPEFAKVRWLKSKLKRTGFFNNLKDVTVDKVISHSILNSSSKSFVSVNCSRSATSERSAYQFVQNFYSFVQASSSRLTNKVCEASTTNDYFLIRPQPELDSISRLDFYRYVDLFHLDFSIEKLLSADITVIDMSELTEITEKRTPRQIEKTSSCSNGSNLKDLECKVNKLLTLQQCSRTVHKDSVSQKETMSRLFSQEILETIIRDVTKNIKNENLNRELPLKLRVFQNDIHRLNLPKRTEYVETWFSENCNID